MKTLLHEIVTSLTKNESVSDVSLAEKDGKMHLDVVTTEENILSLEDIVIHMKAKPAKNSDPKEGADYFDDEKLIFSPGAKLVLSDDSDL